jgi:hypothetical protein
LIGQERKQTLLMYNIFDRQERKQTLLMYNIFDGQERKQTLLITKQTKERKLTCIGHVMKRGGI